MPTPEERLELAADLAENASAIASDFANGSSGRNVTPEPIAGPLPTLAEFLRQKETEIDENANLIAAFEDDLADSNSDVAVASVEAKYVGANSVGTKKVADATTSLTVASRDVFNGNKALKSTDQTAPFISISGQDDVRFSNFIIQGPGLGSQPEPMVKFDGTVNANRIEFDHMEFNGGGVAMEISAGWNNLISQCYFVNMDVGTKHVLSPITPNWSGSGYVNVNSYYGNCNTCIDDTGLWNATYINPIMEYSTNSYVQNQQGTTSVMINPWFEGNTNPPQWRRGTVVIGGVNLDFTDIDLFAGRPAECLVSINRNGVSVFRDVNNPTFAADANGVTSFKPVQSSVGFDVYTDPTLLAEFIRTKNNGGLQGNDKSGTSGFVPIVSFRGKAHNFSSQLANTEPARVEIQGSGTATGSGRGLNRIAFYTGVYESGGAGATNQGYRWYITENGHFTPAADNTYDVGSASFRARVIYAGTGTINTSDERLKTPLLNIETAEKAAALEIKSSIKKYKFTDSVNEKADKARWHFGVGAQTVKAIMESHGLNPDSYAFFCYDQWYEIDGDKVEADDSGKVTIVECFHDGNKVDVDENGIYHKVEYFYEGELATDADENGVVTRDIVYQTEKNGEVVDTIVTEQRLCDRVVTEIKAQRVETEKQAEFKDRYGIRYDELSMFILAAL